MNEHRLSNCLENIDPRFIDEAADYKKKSCGRGVYYFAAALAACVLRVIAAQLRPRKFYPARPPEREGSIWQTTF